MNISYGCLFHRFQLGLYEQHNLRRSNYTKFELSYVNYGAYKADKINQIATVCFI